MDEMQRDFYTKTEVDEKFGISPGIDNGLDFYTKAEILANVGTPETLVLPPDMLDFYTKAEIDSIQTSPIPSGYTEMNYIQSSGAQWISPQMEIPEITDTVKIQTAFSFVVINSAWQGIMSANNDIYQNPNDGYCLYFGADSSGFLVKVSHPSGSDITSASPAIAVSTATDYTADITLGASQTGVTVDGNSFISTIAHGVDIPLLLFASRPSADWGYTEFSSIKMYYCRIYVNNVLVHDLRPCKRDFDNKFGLYDVTAGTFLTNGGTGADFTGG